MSARILIAGFPRTLQEADLLAVLREASPADAVTAVSMAHIERDGLVHPYATVTVPDDFAAQRLISALHGRRLGEVTLRAGWARNNEQRGPGATQGSPLDRAGWDDASLNEVL